MRARLGRVKVRCSNDCRSFSSDFRDLCRLLLVVPQSCRTKIASWPELISGFVVFGDQAFVSATNFFLAAAIVRFFEFEQVGLFALGAGYSRFCVDLARAFLSEPLLLLRDRSSTGARYLRPSILLHFVASIVLSTPLVAFGVVGLLNGWASATVALAFATVLPALTCHEAMRFVSFATKRTVAVRADCAMFVVSIALVLLLPRSLPIFVLGWGACTGVALLIGAALLSDSAAVAPLSLQRYRRAVSKRGLVFLAEATLERGVGQLTLFTIAGLVGVAASGQIQSGRLVFGLVNIALIGLSPALTPALVARSEAGRSMNPPLLVAGLGSTLIVGLVTILVWADPGGVVHRVIQPLTYLGIRPLLPWIGMGVWFGVLTLLLVTYYRVADLIARSFLTRLGVNLAVLVGAVCGALTHGGAVGVVAGMAVARGIFVTMNLFEVFHRRTELSIQMPEGAVGLTIRQPIAEGVRSAS